MTAKRAQTAVLPTVDRLHVAKRFLNAPVAMTRQAASEMLRQIQMAGPGDAPFGGSALRNDERVALVEGIAIIAVKGVLVQQDMGGWGATGYDWIRMAFCEALEDDQVKAIVLDIDSPGGEVAGLFDLVDMVYDARGTKSVRAILSESAYSAAYAIASAADRITVPRTGGSGSVGVIAMLVDISDFLSKAGIKVNIFQFGDRKGDGSGYEELAPEARKRFQSDVDAVGNLFAQTVARNRSIPVSKVLATEAATYLGAAGLERGLVDAVAAPDQASRNLLSTVRETQR